MVATITAASASRNSSSRLGAHGLVEPGVIGERRHPGGGAASRPARRRRRACRHRRRPTRPGRSATSSSTRRVALAALALGRQGELGPGEAGDELARVREPQLGADVLARAGIGGGGDGEARHLREDLGQAAQHAVVGAEVVAPLADAVRLVDGDQREAAGARAAPASPAASGLRARGRAGRARRRRSGARCSTRFHRDRCWSSSRAAATPDWLSAATWSVIRAISGETTRPRPGRSMDGIW